MIRKGELGTRNKESAGLRKRKGIRKKKETANTRGKRHFPLGK